MDVTATYDYTLVVGKVNYFGTNTDAYEEFVEDLLYVGPGVENNTMIDDGVTNLTNTEIE